MLGTARRGYFVEGLGGAQFALAGAVERLRGAAAARRASTCCWPRPTRRNPYGAALPWPKPRQEGRAGVPRARPAPTCCSATASPILYVERGGKGILRLRRARGRGAGARRSRELADGGPRGADPEARDRARRRRAGDRLGARGDADRRRLLAPAAPAGRLELSRDRSDARGRHDPPRGAAHERGARRAARSSCADAPNPRSPLHRRAAELQGRTLERAEARGKHLLVHFSGDLVVHSHLGMNGRWFDHRRRPASLRTAVAACSRRAGRSPSQTGGQDPAR